MTTRISTARTALILMILNAIGLVRPADAATYSGDDGLTLTTLGDGFTLKTDSTGYITDVVGANGQDYRFDKYPVTKELVVAPNQPQITWNNGQPFANTGVPIVYNALTNKYGTVGFDYWPTNNEPTGGASINGLMYYNFQSSPLTSGLKSPVNDFNIHGVIVGTEDGGTAMTTSPSFNTTYGVIADMFPKGLTVQDGSFTAPISLANALYTDDSGQIIVEGKLDGQPQDFLIGQGMPTPAPEPSTLAVVGLGVLGVAARSLSRSRRARR